MKEKEIIDRVLRADEVCLTELEDLDLHLSIRVHTGKYSIITAAVQYFNKPILEYVVSQGLICKEDAVESIFNIVNSILDEGVDVEQFRKNIAFLKDNSEIFSLDDVRERIDLESYDAEQIREIFRIFEDILGTSESADLLKEAEEIPVLASSIAVRTISEDNSNLAVLASASSGEGEVCAASSVVDQDTAAKESDDSSGVVHEENGEAQTTDTSEREEVESGLVSAGKDKEDSLSKESDFISVDNENNILSFANENERVYELILPKGMGINYTVTGVASEYEEYLRDKEEAERFVADINNVASVQVVSIVGEFEFLPDREALVF